MTAYNSKGRFEELAVEVMLLKMSRSWLFHIVVLQVTGKKCIKIKNTRTEQLFSSLNCFLVTFSLASRPWFAKAVKKFSELTWKEKERNIFNW